MDTGWTAEYDRRTPVKGAQHALPAQSTAHCVPTPRGGPPGPAAEKGVSMERAILVSTGGDRPAVHAVDAVTREVTEILSFETGDSPYALARDPSTHQIACGTRRGRLALGQPGGAWDFHGHDAPILTVCFAGLNTVAAGDEFGRVWFVDWGSGRTHMHAPPDGTPAPVSALSRGMNGQVVVLWADGRIEWLPPPYTAFAATVKGPEPAPMGGFVNLVSCSAEGMLAYPAAEGGLVLVEEESKIHHVLPAHEGEFYAVVAYTNGGFTVGYLDSRLLCWRDGWKLPSPAAVAPTGIVAAAPLVSDGAALLLINQAGVATAYAVTESALQHVEDLPLENCRTVLGLDSGALEAARQAWLLAESTYFAEELDQSLSVGDAEGAAECCRALAGLGQEHIALERQMAAALDAGDIVRTAEVLKAALDSDIRAPESTRVLQMGARVLHDVGLWSAAKSLRKTIDAAGASGQEGTSEGSLGREYPGDMEPPGLVEPGPDIPLESILTVAEILACEIRGRYVMAELGELPCSGVAADSESFHAEYMALRHEDARDAFSPAQIEELSYLTQGTARNVRMVTLWASDAECLAGSALSLEIVCRLRITTVCAREVFQVPVRLEAEATMEHLQRVREALAIFRSEKTLRSLWLRDMLAVTRSVLWRLRNRSLHAKQARSRCE